MSQTQQDPAQNPTAAASGSKPVAPVPEPVPADDLRTDRVAAAVRTWQRQLVDLGGRNTLLWYRDLPSGTLDLTTAHPGGMAMLLAGRPTKLSDLVREPTALQEARRRVRTVRAKTLELHEERGVNAGYIAVGMATWRVPGASRLPCAPVLLRSCVLKPTDAAQQDFDIGLGEEVELNPVLAHYLRSEQGIELDTDVLAEMTTFTKGFDPLPVYTALSRMCQRVPAFQIAPRLVLGTFSYAKLPMVADLAAQLRTLADHDVVAALAGDPGALKAVRATVTDFSAEAPPGENLVLDADSSQQAVIDAVRSGANLAVKGPPGTGKSQTIANLIACLASEGKRTLFVAEKRAAIDAVIGRLGGVGLADIVLDVYDGATNRHRLAQDLGRALDRAKIVENPDTAGIERTLVDRRARLVEHRSALHDKRSPWGVSAFDAQVALARLWARRTPPISHVRLHGDVLQAISRTRVSALSQSLTEAASLGAWTAPEAVADPWYGARVTSLEEAQQALEIVDRLGDEGMVAARQRLGRAMREAGLPEARTPRDWGRALAIVEQVRQSLETFRVEVFDLALTDLVAATAGKEYRDAQGLRLGWWSRMRLRGQARRLLRPGPPPSDLHSALSLAQEQRAIWAQLAGTGGRPVVPSEIDEVQRTYQGLADDLGWLGARLATTFGGGDLLGTPLDELQDRCAELARRRDRLAVLPRVVSLIDDLRESGMGALVDDLAMRGVAPLDVGAEMDFVWWTSLLDDISARESVYGSHDGDALRRVAAEYIEADHAHLAGNAEKVRAAWGRRVREAVDDHPEQEALVRVEAAKSRRHRPLRDLMPRAGEMLTAVKPCWAMSPLVVASVLPAGQWFDVVIFDESSQIPPAQAVSAISRATQVVVVGDERQLPPARFSIAALDEEGVSSADDSRSDGFESILDVLSTVLPTHRLTCHYRSLDERLVSFANAQMYDGSLITFPGTGDKAVIALDVVDGSGPVQPGVEAIESTQAEVDRVVQLVLAHARICPRESLGVIALGSTHATRIEDALRGALADDAGIALGDFFEQDRAERFFVKSLERVQGDERDVIILSIGYGKTPHGRVLYRFGALSLDGADRRLNVAITRARRRMTVVSSFNGADLDPARLKARGALMLRDFLLYAAQFGAQSAPVAHQVADSQTAVDGAGDDPIARTQLDPLVTDLALRLRSEGLVVHTGYGSSPQRLDLAVEDPQHPGRVLVAVETDGLRYAAMSSSRDRDRLRVEQLRRRGWVHVRVWSTDLFRDPARDVARISAAVRAASASRPDRSAGKAENTPDAQTADRKRQIVTDDELEQTRDDTDAGWGERVNEAAQDQWLQDQRPPHWG